MSSLAMLNVPKAMEAIAALSPGGPTDDDSQRLRYLQDLSCIEKVTNILLSAANNNVLNIKPLGLAWATILQLARNLADSSTAARDSRQALRAAESIGNSAMSDTESIEGSGERRRPSPNRRTSFGSDSSQPLTYLEEVVDTIAKIEPTDDPINLLARYAVHDADAFELMSEIALNLGNCFGSEKDEHFTFPIRSSLLDLIASSIDHLSYQPALLETVLAILSGSSDYWDANCNSAKALNMELVTAFQADDRLMRRFFYESLSRFPYESIPFLRLCQTFSAAPSPNHQEPLFVPAMLRNISHLTTMFSERDAHYSLKEADDGDDVELSTALEISATGLGTRPTEAKLLLPSRSSQFDSDTADVVLLEPGAIGQALNNGKPLIVRFEHRYSGLRYMGLVLRQALHARHNKSANLSEHLLDIANEIISLLSRLLIAASSQAQDGGDFEQAQELARSILEEASDGLGRSQDVVSVVLETFEDELYEQKAGRVSEVPTSLLAYCIQFIHALLSILPGRVWPFLGKSGLLGLNGAESRLAYVVAVLEVPQGQFSFLLNTVNLFEALVDNAVTHSVSRRGASNSMTRFGATASGSMGAGITEALMRSILLHFERIMIEVFESTANWRFGNSQQRLHIDAAICRTFSKILSYCFDTDDEEDLSKKLSSALAPSAEYLLDVFLSNTSNDLPTQPLIQALHDGANSSPDTIPISFGRARVNLTEEALRFVGRLVRTNSLLGRPASRLQQQLFASTSAAAKCYAVHERYRAPVVQLLEALVHGSSRTGELPPSLLGHLGQQVAKSFIDLLARLDEPLDSPELERHIWRLLSSVVSKRQQWFAIYILTGSTPKASLRGKTGDASKPRPHAVFELAMTKLRKISQTNASELVHVLEFISLAADFWPGVCASIRSDVPLVKSLAEYLERLGETTPEQTSTEPDLEATRIQVAAHIVNLFAIIAHRSNEIHDTTFAKQILPHLQWLLKEGVSTPRYNASLHARLRKNFEGRYSTVKVSQFKQTTMARPQLGRAFYYDIALADMLLQHDAAWNKGNDRGFRNEFILANRNLSLVEAQMVSLFSNVLEY
jgi:nuclear pore complex protein Nup188